MFFTEVLATNLFHDLSGILHVYYKLKGNMGVKHLCTKDMSDGEKNKKIRPALFKAIASPIC